ncbi:MAG: hypothetical protein ACOYJQ_18640 [Pseudochelatococcus sp.]|jgi:hypothetical protein|uniref:hypothetical protein n=1 Tax=Pseudochelatococcus sp. TaxID=2020869 RepID=UPI003D9287D0
MKEKIEQGFTVTTSNDDPTVGVSINGSGIGFGAWFGLLFIGLLVGAPMALVAGMNGFVATLAFFGLVAFLWDRSRKRRYEFTVTETAVRMPNGKEYAKGDISELLIRNQSGKTVYAGRVEWTQSSTVVVGVGVTGAAMAGAAAINNVAGSLGRAAGQMGADAGAAIKQSLARRGNALCIRHGRNVIPLAKYLREDDAIALFNKVRELL